MKILFVTPSIPYPPHTGGQLRSYHLLRYLESKGEVMLVSIGRPEQCAPYMQELKKYCAKIFLADPARFKTDQGISKFEAAQRRVLQFLKFQSWMLEDFIDPEICKQIDLAKPEEYDLIVVRFAVMAYHFLTNSKFKKLIPKILIDIDDVSTIVQERTVRQIKFSYKKMRNLIDLFFLKRYYHQLRHINASLAVSEKDRTYLLNYDMSRNVFVIPNMFEVNGRSLTLSEQVKEPEILFCGMLSYPPNQDAVFFFVEKIFPKIQERIPNAHLTIIGKHTPEKIMKLGMQRGITVAGYVPSMEPYYDKAAIVVVPLLNGGGSRIKILEAFSLERPVVSTSVGAEGLDVKNGEHIIIADEPNDFANECVELLNNPNQRKRITSNAYRLVKEKYDIPVFRKKMDEVFEFVAERSSPR